MTYPKLSRNTLLGLFICISLALTMAPTLAQDAATTGDTVTIAMWEDRDNFNPYMEGGQTFQSYVAPVLERLISFDAEGTPIPVLTTDIPSVENGLMSEDGKTITFNLRPDVFWADGEPMTCEDVQFSIEAVQNPDNIVTTRAGFEQIDSVECADDLTAVFHYKQFYAAWMTVPWYVIPKHILGQEANWNEAEWNTMPIGTGPFYVCESIPNDHFTWCKNEHYWQEGKPLLDKIIVLWIPDREVLKARFVAGDIALAYGLSELDATEIQDTPNLDLYMEYGGGLEELPINLSPSTGEHTGDPEYSNPVTGDIRVRQALELATPKQEIVDSILGGLPRVIESPVPAGWGLNPDIPLSEYNPEKARQLLEEAGWVDTDGDGIREKDGVRMHVTMMGSNARYRLLYMQLLQQEWADIGVEVEILTPEPSVRWAAYNEGGPVRRGEADLQAWGTGFGLDPIPGYNQFYRCDQIPSDENPTFWNVTRYCNPEFEQALDAAEHEMDFERRLELLKQAALTMHNDLPTIPLYQQPRISAINKTMLAGYMPEAGPNYWEYPFTYAADWYVPES
jgi:peptide/nickel transport system substrate-binding protein